MKFKKLYQETNNNKKSLPVNFHHKIKNSHG